MTSPNTASASLDARVRDAFDAMGPDEATRARVLSALRERAAEDPAPAPATPAVEKSAAAAPATPAVERPAPATRAHPSRGLRVVLPLAACLALVAIVVTAGALGRANDAAPMNQAAPQSERAAEEALVVEDVEPRGAEKGLMEAEPADEDAVKAAGEAYNGSAPAQDAWSACPYVELGSGTVLRTGSPTDATVDESRAVAATARDTTGSKTWACTVVDDAFVRYEGDDVWRDLVAVDEPL